MTGVTVLDLKLKGKKNRKLNYSLPTVIRINNSGKLVTSMV